MSCTYDPRGIYQDIILLGIPNRQETKDHRNDLKNYKKRKGYPEYWSKKKSKIGCIVAAIRFYNFHIYQATVYGFKSVFISELSRAITSS
jgi:hypothetical protein